MNANYKAKQHAARLKVVLYPVFQNQENLNDLYHRICWYLPGFQDNQVIFPVNDQTLRPASTPSDFGACNKPKFEIQYRVVQENIEAHALLQEADYVLLWKDDLNIMERYNLGGVCKTILNVDKTSQTSRHEAYHFAILRHELMSKEHRQNLIDDNKNRFELVAAKLKTDKVYVFGTGPSLEDAYQMDFADGLRIVCNTIVRNRKLLEHLKPQVIVAADPALHYGVSKYAAQFRGYLIQAMRRYNAYLFMPMGYYPLFVNHYPEMAKKCFGVPIVPELPENISMDLMQKYQIACYANILTLFLLPLGATLAEEIFVLGCDGRHPGGIGDNSVSPFWQHHKESEFEEIYATLKACHPSFFMLDYTDWYTQHCQGVNLLIEHGEKAGKTFTTLTRSFIPALYERLTPELKENTRLIANTFEAVSDTPAEFEVWHDNRVKSNYKVSVIVSIYNAQRFISPMLENLFSQTLYQEGQVEIILIDSASHQNEKEIIFNYMRRYEHLFYGRTAKRETVYGAFNRAIKIARGKYITNLDTDNRLRNDALEIFSNYLDTHPDIGLVYGDQYITQFENESFYNHVRFGYCRRPEYSLDMMLHKFYFGSELMWRCSLHEEVGYFDEDFVVAGDYEMVCRFATVTKFAHIKRFFGLYFKNLKGVEYSNLKLCEQEDRIIRKRYKAKFPVAVDPPRVHVHFPIDEKSTNDYMTIICHTQSFDRPVTPFIMKIFDNLEYPYIIYSLDQNSSQATKDSIAYLVGEGYLSSGDNLLPKARGLFNFPIAYQPEIHFYLLAYGKVASLTLDFMEMKRPGLTRYFKKTHHSLTKRFRSAGGGIDPRKVKTFCDYHEFESLELEPHFRLQVKGRSADLDRKMAVLIQHYAPANQTTKYRQALKRCIESIRTQQYSAPVDIIVSDDGSHWSRSLGSDQNHICVYVGKELQQFSILRDLNVDAYLYKPRTGYFSKAVLWNAAVSLCGADLLVFLDDDHHFLHPGCLALYIKYLQQFPVVIGHTRKYVFRDIDGVQNELQLDFESAVVQGSNFGLQRKIIDRIGGFEPRTFLWGTGDDPALFWKLYLLLHPERDLQNFQCCYVDDIVTENPYSGRWRKDCRLDIELFIRDFMRLYGVHPNSNESRNRKLWVQHIAFNQRDVPVNGKRRSRSLEIETGPALSVVIPAIDTLAPKVWETVVSVLEQKTDAPFETLLVKNEDARRPDESQFPASVKIIKTDADNFQGLLKAGLEAAEGDYAGWILPGAIMAEKTLKAAFTGLAAEQFDVLYGSSCEVDDRGLEVRLKHPPGFSLEKLAHWAVTWEPGGPVFGRTVILRSMIVESALQEPWELDFLLRVSEKYKISNRQQVFSVHTAQNEGWMEFRNIARLLNSQSNGRLERILAGSLRTLATVDRVRNGPKNSEWRGLAWLHAMYRKNIVIQGLFNRLHRAGISKVVLYGAGEHTRSLLSAYWPRGIKIICIIDDRVGKRFLGTIPVLSASDQLPPFDAVVISSKKHERQLYEKSIAKGWHPVFPIYLDDVNH